VGHAIKRQLPSTPLLSTLTVATNGQAEIWLSLMPVSVTVLMMISKNQTPCESVGLAECRCDPLITARRSFLFQRIKQQNPPPPLNYPAPDSAAVDHQEPRIQRQPGDWLAECDSVSADGGDYWREFVGVADDAEVAGLIIGM
jgi:hypothetical protein